MTCIITGAALIGHDGCAWGDLHQIGDCFVFVGCMRNGEMDWDHQLLDHEPVVGCDDIPHHWYLERRGIAVFPVGEATLYTNARRLLEGQP